MVAYTLGASSELVFYFNIQVMVKCCNRAWKKSLLLLLFSEYSKNCSNYFEKKKKKKIGKTMVSTRKPWAGRRRLVYLLGKYLLLALLCEWFTCTIICHSSRSHFLSVKMVRVTGITIICALAKKVQTCLYLSRLSNEMHK